MRIVGAATTAEHEGCKNAVSAVLLRNGFSPDADVEVVLAIDRASLSQFPAPGRPDTSSQPRIRAEIGFHNGGTTLRGAGMGLMAASACASAAERLAIAR